MQCPRCNSENDYGEKFCRFCGAPLNDTQLVEDKKKVKNMFKKKQKTKRKSTTTDAKSTKGKTQPMSKQRTYSPKEKIYRRSYLSTLISFLRSIIILIVLLIFIYFVGKYLITLKVSTGNKYSVGGDKISSVRYVVGDRDVESVDYEYEEGTFYKIYTFEQSDTLSADLTKYISYLMENYSYQLLTGLDLSTETGETIIYAVSESTYGYYNIIEISWKNSAYTLKLYSVNESTLESLKN